MSRMYHSGWILCMLTLGCNPTFVATTPSFDTAAGSFDDTDPKDPASTDTVELLDDSDPSSDSDVVMNSPPTAEDIEVVVVEDTSVSFQLMGTDPEDDILTWTLETLPAHGVLQGEPPQLVYTPDPDFHGEDAFLVRASDGVFETGSAIVTVVITPQNDPPTATDSEVSTLEDVPLSIPLMGHDVDRGDVLSFQLQDLPEHGTVTLSGSVAEYMPPPDFFGVASFTYLASDGSLASEPATVSIETLPVNDAPTALIASMESLEDEPLVVSSLASDVDHAVGTLEVVVTEGPAHGQAVITGTSLSYAPELDYHGSDLIRFLVTDPAGESTAGEVQLTVLPVTDMPRLSLTSVETLEDTPVEFVVVAEDPDSDLYPAVTVRSATAGTVTPIDGTRWIFTPPPDQHGSFAVIASATSVTGLTTEASGTVTVRPVDDPPTAEDLHLTVLEDSTTPLVVTARDIDTPVADLSWSLVSPPQHGVLVGELPYAATYTPDADYVGEDTLDIAVSGASGTAMVRVSIEVTPVNDPPTLALEGPTQTLEDQPLSLVWTADDPDGDPLTLGIVTWPSHGELTIAAGRLDYTPGQDQHGWVYPSVRACDPQNVCSAPLVVPIEIVAVNDPPRTQPQPLTVPEDAELSMVLDVFEPDGDPVTVTITRQPAQGTATIQGTVLTYTPPDDYFGQVTLSYEASDGILRSPTTNVIIDVLGQPDPPTLRPGLWETEEDVPLAITLDWSDPDDETPTFLVERPPSHGTVEITLEGVALYTPEANFHGVDAFEVIVRDETFTSPSRVQDIVVRAVDDPPVSPPKHYQTAGNTTLTVSAADGLLEGVSDVDQSPGDTLQVVPTTQVTSEGGLAILQADGSFHYTPPRGIGERSDSLTYSLSQGAGRAHQLSATIGLGRVAWFVDSSAGSMGDGTSAAPFQRLEHAEASSQPGDVLLLFPGVGYTDPIQLKERQTLWGLEDDLILDGQTIAAAENAPVFTVADGPAITLATDAQVHHVHVIDSDGPAIVGQEAHGALLASLEIVAPQGHGIHLVLSDDVTVEDTQVIRPELHGILSEQSSHFTARRIEVETAGGHGIALLDNYGSQSLTTITVREAGGHGVSVEQSSLQDDLVLEIQDAVLEDSAAHLSTSGAAHASILLQDVSLQSLAAAECALHAEATDASSLHIEQQGSLSGLGNTGACLSTSDSATLHVGLVQTTLTATDTALSATAEAQSQLILSLVDSELVAPTALDAHATSLGAAGALWLHLEDNTATGVWRWRAPESAGDGTAALRLVAPDSLTGVGVNDDLGALAAMGNVTDALPSTDLIGACVLTTAAQLPRP